MLPKRNYYLNDYFDIFNSQNAREKEYMKTDIYEHDNKYVLEIDLPGIKKENIKIAYKSGYLTITADRINLTNQNKYIRRERYFGILKRSFYIGIKKESDFKAQFSSGILSITFPKQDYVEKDTKNITIS